MQEGHVERRRGRRADVQAPVIVRRLGKQESGSTQQEVTGNVSLAGVYFETAHSSGYTVNEVVMASVAIPESERRHFPFTRLTGRSRVVRVSELPTPGTAEQQRIGVALEFGEDLTALTAIPRIG